MTLVKYRPKRARTLVPAESVWPRDIFRWFDEFDPLFFSPTVDPHRFNGEWTPAVDVFERNGDLVVMAEIPGIDAKELDVTVEDNVLRLRGERKHESETEKEGYYRHERFHGTFERSIPLPAEVETEKIDATYTDGVLEIVLPKAAETAARRIEVKPKRK